MTTKFKLGADPELFLKTKTGFGFEATPPLDEFDFDRDDLLEELADQDIT